MHCGDSDCMCCKLRVYKASNNTGLCEWRQDGYLTLTMTGLGVVTIGSSVRSLGAFNSSITSQFSSLIATLYRAISIH